ncbi:TIGR03013 family XrtA/PEP-CTERM system glycosyltransferase [Hydrogenophaga sp. BPS33]|uniref:TIGR03013 family XrtA/PEP-CTERM system glycosyltransferase n=1 Tax=Hydrogenophaga sp. BPS33 TaxID=2651974 RepID=UPI00131FD737|nr:TIGR03013 family XrtA/PEP-CTERM system glycosyltransferase [Hydrogenophaga sp. BPS33]QHE85944.1 TIGR03013 family PEP-CTERM/XrtA system glycosyltransferase [Hydrogenophaga sp. BPS33]
MIKLFNHYFDRRTLAKMFMDLLLITVAFMATLVILTDAEELTVAQFGQGLFRAVLMSAGFLGVNSALGLYDRGTALNNTQLRARVLVSFLMMGVIVVGVLLLLPVKAFWGHTWAVVIVMMATGLLLVIQVLTGEILAKSLARRRVLVYGTGVKAQAVGDSLKRPASSAELCGYFASPNEREHLVTSWGTLGSDQTLTEVVTQKRIDEIVVALSERRGGSMPMRELLDCKLAGVRVTDIATYFEQELGQIRLDAVSAGWLIFGDGFDQGFVRTTIKRLFDLAGAVVLILLALPIMAVTALIIKLESSGPVLYKQERVGLNNKPFNVVKFRSMRTDAEKDGVPRWATAGDSRVTRVGKVIRKLRIDELPQLFSVLNGDMSLVGPRPERAFFVEKLAQEIPFYAVRHSVKPGVTGWAQVRFPYGATVEDTKKKLQFDLYYVKNHSLFLDLVVIFETIGVVLTGKGAQ